MNKPLTASMKPPDIGLLFSQFSDEELSRRVASGELTEKANAIAMAELSSRGLPVPELTASREEQNGEYLGDMVILERGMSSTEAHLLCSCLQAAGIYADAGDTNFVQTYALLSIAVGGASVRVPQSQVTEAKEIVLAFRRGDYSLSDDFNADDLHPDNE